LDAYAKGVIALIVLVVAAAIGFFAYPAVVMGTGADSLAASVNHEDASFESEGENWIWCRPGDPVEWRCGPYDVNSDWRGCWEAHAHIGFRPPLSGCIDMLDVLGFRGPLPDPS
jgi:hypothetical protein